MKIPQKWSNILLALISIAVLISAGSYYLNSLQKSLWKQSVENILEVTLQGSHAFEVYLEKDAEMLTNLTRKLSQKGSQDADLILDNLILFGGSDANYTVIVPKYRVLYSNLIEESYKLTEEQLSQYEKLEERGIKEPYLNEYMGQNTIGYYEWFTFADGVRGIIQKTQLVSEVAEEFSLSFYNDSGFSYLVNENGDILIHSHDKDSNRTFLNIFSVLEKQGNRESIIEDFHNSMLSGEKGVVSLNFDDEEHVFAYVPIQDVKNWYLISIVPNDVVMAHAGTILRTSQIFVFFIGFGMFLFGIFIFLSRQNHKYVMEKEIEIQYREQMFNILANNTDDVFLMLSTDTYKLEYISPNVERVLGISQEEAKANIKSLNMVSYSNGKKMTYEILQSIQQEGSIESEAERVHRKTGERRWFSETVYRANVDNSDRFIAVLSDRTKEKQSKYALEEALEIAKVANESKSTFLGNMSHDIRTPMNAIVGLVTLLQKDANNPEKVREYAKKIAASSQHLLGLINDVLDMSKIESGKTTLNVTEISLAEIIEELGTIIRPQTKAKQQEFEINVFDISSERLLGDKLRINQVLINILSNAVKYTPVGGRIEMIVRQLPQNTKNYAHLRFIVKDNGIGMSKEYLKTVFDPFTREINSITNKVQGTGLGMAITKNLIDLMGGTISVESKPRKGTTFTVDLELRFQAQKIDQNFWKKHGVTHTLVVDDDVEICTSIIGAMAGTGVAMQFAVDGYSAVQMVKNAHEDERDFNLILLDWKMPGMNGIETAKRIREILPLNVPIMILTAYDWADIEEEALSVGISGFLTKPFFLSNFKQTIENMREKEQEKANIKTEEQVSVLKGKHILAAEDNELNSEILLELLDMVGAACEVAKNGQEVYKKFIQSEPGKYDMILMDVQMPIMNGYEATQAIRGSSHPLAKTIPIIAMTANAFVEDIKDALDSGMNAHIAKPVDMEQLEVTVKDIFSQGETL